MIPRLLSSVSAAALALLSAGMPQAQAQAPKAELVSVEKIWDKGSHNAFTDITRFQNLFYCAFREADGDAGKNGVIRLLLSASGKTWIDAGTVSESGVDLRDPKLLVTPDEKRIYLLCSGVVYDGTQVKSRRSRYATTLDGKVWTPLQKLLNEGETLGRAAINPADKRFYSAVYNIHPNSGGPAPEKEFSLKTFASADGSVWQLNSIMNVPGQPNDAVVRFLKNGSAMALVKRDAMDKRGVIGTAQPPYREWTWASAGVPLGGPNFIELPDGKLIAGSRGFGATPGPHMVLFAMAPTGLAPILELPSGGDCSYPGFYWHDDLLHVTYYSSHEGKAAIYYARVKVQ